MWEKDGIVYDFAAKIGYRLLKIADVGYLFRYKLYQCNR
jgi:hypothetical protein